MENKHKQFAPFDRVLVRDEEGKWLIDFYSHRNEDWNHVVLSFGPGLPFLEEDILPFEGHEHLLGTTDEPEEEVKLEKGEYGFFVTKPLMGNPQYYSFGRFSCTTNDCIINSSGFFYNYFIRFSDFNPNDMEETRKHILCVKNGRIVKYKE